MTFQVVMVSIRNPSGLMVRSLDCHAVDLGSILGTPKTSLTKSSNIPQIISPLPDHKKAHFKGNLVKLLGLYCVPESWSTLMEPFKRTSIRAEGP